MLQSRMTNQSKKNFSDDPGVQIDSGFLSGQNITVLQSEQEQPADLRLHADREHSEVSSWKIQPDVDMRVDSGIVEAGLSDTMSQLTLTHVTINHLRGKVQAEPTDQLAPVTGRRFSHHSSPVDEDSYLEQAQQLWKLYYSQDEDGDTQLHIAIVQGFHEVAMSLIRMSPHPSLFDCLNSKRQAPLHLAVYTHQPSIVRRLILAGADASLRNSDGNTALHLAAASGDLACARALTEPISSCERMYLTPGRQAPAIPQDLEQRNYEGETCLHAAVVAGNTEVVRLLISVGADLEAKERLGGRTALHLAIECRRKGVTSLLLQECNPQLDALTYGGVTAYEIAAAWDTQLAKELGRRLGATSSRTADFKNNDKLAKIPQLWQSVGLRA
ncbi:NF-kappa-B inhibitor cactus-like [Neodiprion virginianus]|uniref:NF-kappa-B inhibitor cactus-like n=1 Tax=Neodiprion virginianus TaxID=2961670 RepID=UPI001EE746E9|nr:NF-kappa-B inhibitor cactus-like [Neodiprion virginianus]